MIDYRFEAASKAFFWHKGQLYGDQCYSVHLMAVADMVERMGGDHVHVSVAYLHDIVEDTAIEVQELWENFSCDIVEAVLAVSKAGESYPDYIAKVRANPIALKVKIADTLCNLTQSVIEGNVRRIHKYTTQLQLLTHP